MKLLLFLGIVHAAEILSRLKFSGTATEYIFLDEKLTFAEAEIACEGIGTFENGQLVRPQSVAEVQQLRSLTSIDKSWWTGYIRKNLSLPSGLPSSYGLPSFFQYTNQGVPWTINQPGANEEENCLVEVGGSWEDRTCSVKQRVMCQRPLIGNTMFSFESKDYEILINGARTQGDALQYCASQNKQLLTPESLAESDFLFNTLKPFFNMDFNIWLSYKKVENTPEAGVKDQFELKTEFGRQGNEFPWERSSPSGIQGKECVVLSSIKDRTDFKWKSTDCNNLNFFVCESARESPFIDLSQSSASLKNWTTFEHDNIEYLVLNNVATHKNAEILCSSIDSFAGGSLIKPVIPHQVEFLDTFLHEVPDYWLSYKRINSSTLGNITYNYNVGDTLNTTSVKSPWMQDKPEHSSYTSCVFATKDGWSESSCGIKRRVVCQRSSMIVARRLLDGYEYAFLKGSHEAREAHDLCASLDDSGFPNGEVVSPQTIEENIRVIDFIREIMRHSVPIWLNFERTDFSGSFYPVDYGWI